MISLPSRAACSVLALAACHAAPSGSSAPESGGSAFAFLAAKYDRDGDGAVSAREYDRSSDAFARLDSNADGELTADDFPEERWARDLGIRDIPPDVRARLDARYAARAVVLAYLGPPAGAGAPELPRDELEQGFARLDFDASGALDRAEFGQATARLPWGGPGEAWDLLLAAVDAPEDGEPDGLVALAELLAYHEGMSGPEGVLRGPAGVDPREAAPGLAGDGPPVGALAPDFELASPDGGARTRLSQWRGKKPVALVFGSYT
jgi:Ca2+-binding EF-hand superfamily protein